VVVSVCRAAACNRCDGAGVGGGCNRITMVMRPITHGVRLHLCHVVWGSGSGTMPCDGCTRAEQMEEVSNESAAILGLTVVVVGQGGKGGEELGLLTDAASDTSLDLHATPARR
jgi:hypothetical protein